MPPFRRSLSLLRVDAPVATILAGNIGIGVLSILQLALIARNLSEAEQGITFGFVAFFQIIALLDFGFGVVIQQIASHERAFLHENRQAVLEGPELHRARLSALLKITVRGYLVIYVLVVPVFLVAGWLFFNGAGSIESLEWKAPWVLAAVVSALCMVSQGCTRFLTGCGDVLAGTRVVMMQVLLAALAYCIVLALGGKLYAFAAGHALALTAPFIWYLFIRRPLLVGLWKTKSDSTHLTWQRDVLPFQVRIALSLLSSQAIQLVVPVTLTFFGPEESGRLGMSLAVVSALQLLGLNWLETRVPVFGNLVAKRNWMELDRVYMNTLVKSTTFMAIILGSLLGVNFALNQTTHPAVIQFVTRFLPPASSGLLVLMTLATHVYFVRAAYLRAHCQEPYLFVNVLQAVALIATMIVAGRLGTMNMVLAGCLFWLLIIGQGLGYGVFFRLRRKWHASLKIDN